MDIGVNILRMSARRAKGHNWHAPFPILMGRGSTCKLQIGTWHRLRALPALRSDVKHPICRRPIWSYMAGAILDIH